MHGKGWIILKLLLDELEVIVSERALGAGGGLAPIVIAEVIWLLLSLTFGEHAAVGEFTSV